VRKLLLILILTLNFGCLEALAQETRPSPAAKTGDEKDQEEYRKKVAEVQEKNKKIAENNEKINRALADGAKAYNEKRYETALEKFDEGYNLDPDFVGSAPVLLNNKALALTALGAEKYNNAIKTGQNPALESNRYFLDAILALKEAQKILRNAVFPEGAPFKLLAEKNLYLATKQMAECYRLLTLTDESRVYEAIEAFENYIGIEKDELLRQKAVDKLKELKKKYKVDY
jgi:tetratricopeptide (TPR) repeat protein